MTDGTRIKVAALKKALIEATGPGKSFSRRGLSLAAGLGPDAVRDILSGKSKVPAFDTVVSLANALDVNPHEFIEGANSGFIPDAAIERIPVVGTVQAGVWREAEIAAAESSFAQWIYVEGREHHARHRFGLRVEGRSMDLVYPPGCILDCLAVFWGVDEIPSGEFVIVQRSRGDLFEYTVKELVKLDDGSFELRAHSTLPEFSKPIPIGRPDEGYVGDEEIVVIATVEGSYVPKGARMLR